MRPRLSSLALPLTLAACSGAPAPVATPTPTPVDPGPTLPPIQSPARWSLRPTEVGAVTARLDLPDGCLYGTDAGTRWLVRRGPKGACAGTARPSADTLDEGLLALFTKGTELVGIGSRGSAFRAPSVGASFERVERGGAPIHAASGGPELVLGASLGGALLTLEDAGWRRLALPPAAHAADVAVLGKAAIVLAMPEAVYVTDDGGRTFEHVKLGTVGAVRASRSTDGALVVVGKRGHVVWRPAGSAFSTKSGLSIEADVALDDAPTLAPEPRPSAEPVQGGFAAIVGDQYLHVANATELAGRDVGDGSQWLLLSGKLDGSLEERRLELGAGCASIALGATLGRLAFGCVDTSDDEAPVMRLYVSTGPGAKAELATTLALAEPGIAPRLAVAASGAVLVTSACPGTKQPCAVGAPVLVSPSSGGWAVRRAAASELEGPVTGAPAFSPDGARAYFFGRRAKDDRACLFVSRDAGVTFTCAPFELAPPSTPPDGLAPDRDVAAPFVEPTPEARITIGEDGTLGFPVVLDAGLTWATADDEGRTTVHPPPIGSAIELVAGHGRRALTLRLEFDEALGDSTAIYFETLDGGATWQRLGAPAAVKRAEPDVFAHGLACGHAGCVVGSSAVRFGWNGDAAASDVELTPPPAPPPPVQVLRTPLVCETVPTVAWQKLEGAAGRAPSVDSLARGKTLFSYASVTKDGELVITSSDLPEGDAPPRLGKKVLLAKPPRGQRTFELLALTQAEGFAAVRLSLAEKRTPDESDLGKPMRNVEVAWEHLVEGTSGRARLADAGVIEPGDLGGGQRLSAFVSMSRRGVFVRPHREQVGKTFFVEPSGKARELSYPQLPPGYRAEAVLASGPSGDEPLAVGISIDDARGDYGVLIGKSARGFGARDGERWSFTAVTAARGAGGPAGDLVRNDYGWSHVAGRELGLVVTSATEAGEGFSTYSPFLATGQLGTAIELPTAYDLPETPKPCSAAERRDTPRGVYEALGAPFPPFPGTRHPVLVTDAPPPGAKKGTPSASPVALLTDAVVVQGTKAAPCVAAWSARSPMRGTFVGGERVAMSAVIAGDLKHAWLLRSPAGVTEARPMRCKLDPTASAPDLSGEPGNARRAPLRP